MSTWPKHSLGWLLDELALQAASWIELLEQEMLRSHSDVAWDLCKCELLNNDKGDGWVRGTAQRLCQIIPAHPDPSDPNRKMGHALLAHLQKLAAEAGVDIPLEQLDALPTAAQLSIPGV